VGAATEDVHGLATPNCTGRTILVAASSQIDNVNISTVRVSRAATMTWRLASRAGTGLG